MARAADQCAELIECPVERLRFLRTAPPPRRRFQRLRSWFSSPFAVALFLFTIPPPALRAPLAATARTPSAPESATVAVERMPQVWRVEATAAFETWSNGLRIDNRFSVATRPRSYLAFSSTRPDDIRGERGSVPAGIVFHTTESYQAPFGPEQNATLERAGESMLAWVKLKRAYNFVIDRFGRVYRVVREGDVASHAGFSVWSDAERVYLDLNESFLAVSLETRTLPGQTEATVNPAQIRSAAMLTEMLRARYGIPAGNCVTHAQVSVNPSDLRIGYHLDWASSFPFEQVGLPDNYALPLPAVSLFGLEYDTAFARHAGARLLLEAQLADRDLRDHAASAGLRLAAYRAILQRRYRNHLAVVHHGAGRAEDE